MRSEADKKWPSPNPGWHSGMAALFSLLGPRGRGRRCEPVDDFQPQCPAPQPSPRAGGEKEWGMASRRALSPMLFCLALLLAGGPAPRSDALLEFFQMM